MRISAAHIPFVFLLSSRKHQTANMPTPAAMQSFELISITKLALRIYSMGAIASFSADFGENFPNKYWSN